MVYESGGATRAAERRQSPPGMHARSRRASTYGQALREKQKIKHYYGLGERQLRRMFDIASRQKGNTGQQLLVFCDFQVNGVKVTSPSYILRPGDVITVRPRKNLQIVYRLQMDEAQPQPMEWLTSDAETLRATMQGLPGPSDISLPVDANTVVEFLSR
jgi:small subunit ribosomal protein S4